MNQDPLYQAFEHFQAGRLDQAAEFCRNILVHHPDHPGTNHLLGVIYFRMGRHMQARDVLARASGASGANAEVHNNYGAVLNALGDAEGAIAAFKRALAVDPNYADALNNLGVIYRDLKRTGEAIEVFQQAVALNPALAPAQANLRAAYRDVVPPWHFAMVDDKRRNDAYEAAIKRAVPGRRVLDIGTGTGLLSMMAARAGAKSVVSCEMVSLIADRARDIVARNGFADRIQVIGRKSTDLMVGRELSERAQVLITETFSSTLLNEGVLPTIEHAYQQLLTMDAIVIPSAASAMGYLAGGDVLKGILFAGETSGFDLSPFNDFAPPTIAVVLDALPHDILSDDIELLRFDLRQKVFPMGSLPLSVTATKPGVCVGVAQWIRLELDADARYENRPEIEAAFNGHWTHYVYRFPELLTLNAGDVVKLQIRHDRSQISVDLVDVIRV